MRNIRELPCFGRLNNRKRRERQQAKDADKPEPKGEGYGWCGPLSHHATCDSLGGQADAKSSQSDHAEHG